MAELGWSYNVMGRKTDASSSTWNRWCTQGKLPRREALISFADAAPRVIEKTELVRLWELAWAAQEARQTQGSALEPTEEQHHNTSVVPAGRAQPVTVTGSVPQEGRRMTRAILVSVSGLAAAVIAGTSLLWTLGSDTNTSSGSQGPPPVSSAAASPSPAVSCHGSACAWLEPAQSICAGDAVTAYSGNQYGAVIELRYSARCSAAWAKMSKTSPGDRVVITPAQGPAEEYRQQYGRDAHTRMVAADKPEDARACAIVQDRGTVCATEPGAPAAAPH
ncbi:DUF2690 domain-containing protein [Streptomyces sp. NPDC001373]|uniref:DUF2690 domain-containing protein n=1 Tax=Streptomyces sp. NPDC001373 TaxID=3364565 RepID=UPI0036BCDB65